MASPENTQPPKAAQPEREPRPCPICGKPRDARYDPFCSPRCADVDLHRWLSGRYVIPGATPALDAVEDDGEG